MIYIVPTCYVPKHSRMGIARTNKITKRTKKVRRRYEERPEYAKKSSELEKKKSQRTIITESKYNNNKHNIVVSYKKCKNDNEI